MQSNYKNINEHIGVVFGRFQVLHNGHLEHISEAFSRCDYLYIGISNPDPSATAFDAANPDRSENSSNPFTYYERATMIDKALHDINIKSDHYSTVPFPINRSELLCSYISPAWTIFMSVYETWDERKIEILNKNGFNRICVMYDRLGHKREINSTIVRNKIKLKEDISKFVPRTTMEFIIGLPESHNCKR